MSEEPRFAPNGNRLPERLPVGHRLVDTSKKQWIIGPSIGCGGFGDIYLTRQYTDRDDLKRLTQEQIIRESCKWTNVIKFEHFSGPLFAEINFYLRCARKETVEEYMMAKKLKHLGMPRFVASGIYDPLKDDNPPPVCKNTMSSKTSSSANGKPPAAKRGRQAVAVANGLDKKANGAIAKQRKISNSAQSKEKKYRFLVLERFGDDIQKVWSRANERFDMKSAFNIALNVIDTLEYIHSHGYVHADVKASNLLVDFRNGCSSENNGKSITNTNGFHNHHNDDDEHDDDNSYADKSIINGTTESTKKRTSRVAKKSVALKRERPESVSNGISNTNGKSKVTNLINSIESDDQIYLIDFGLVERFYSKDGQHREYVEDQRRANNGTVEFSSRDAHIGAFSRRSDLESLGYNLLYWVSGGRLPWTNVLKDHQLVEASKKWYMDNLEVFVNYCFNEEAYPIDPLKLIKGLDPIDNTHSAKSSTSSHNYPNGHTNGRSRHSLNNNGSTISTTSTKASTTISKTSKVSAASRASAKRAKSITSASSTTSSSSSSTNDSIMCTALYDFLSYISKLKFEDEPDYYLLKSILSNALGVGSSTRTARKRGSQSLKKTPPKLPKCEKLTPAMREVLEKMKMSSKKH